MKINNRNVALDLVRVIACLLVMIQHSRENSITLVTKGHSFLIHLFTLLDGWIVYREPVYPCLSCCQATFYYQWKGEPERFSKNASPESLDRFCSGVLSLRSILYFIGVIPWQISWRTSHTFLSISAQRLDTCGISTCLLVFTYLFLCYLPGWHNAVRKNFGPISDYSSCLHACPISIWFGRRFWASAIGTFLPHFTISPNSLATCF